MGCHVITWHRRRRLLTCMSWGFQIVKLLIQMDLVDKDLPGRIWYLPLHSLDRRMVQKSFSGLSVCFCSTKLTHCCLLFLLQAAYSHSEKAPQNCFALTIGEIWTSNNSTSTRHDSRYSANFAKTVIWRHNSVGTQSPYFLFCFCSFNHIYCTQNLTLIHTSHI